MSGFGWTAAAMDGTARAGLLQTAHGAVPTPTFMPVGTAGTVKAMTMDAVRSTGAGLVLGAQRHDLPEIRDRLRPSFVSLNEAAEPRQHFLIECRGILVRSDRRLTNRREQFEKYSSRSLG